MIPQSPMKQKNRFICLMGCFFPNIASSSGRGRLYTTGILQNKPALLVFCILTAGLVFITPPDSNALTPDEILVIANRNSAEGVALARYYMNQRNIPVENLLLLTLADRELVSRKEYESKVALPVRSRLQEKEMAKKIRCLLTLFGIPLKIASPIPTPEEKNELAALLLERDKLNRTADKESREDGNPLEDRLKKIKKKIKSFQFASDKVASLDSELSLVKRTDYSLAAWLPNPFYISYRDRKLPIPKTDVLMVGRLDGPSPAVVKRVIDDSILTEKKGLKGTAYFDARWTDPGRKKLQGYKLYDRSIHTAAQTLKDRAIPVVKDDTEKLFQPGNGPDAALYCGWYSLARYVDAFTWKTGSVGYHIASAECTTLRNKMSRVWCKMMLEKGIAATIGPVGEPYVQAFPLPELFFNLLTDGYLTLAECYFISVPHISWKMVLVGDPLYRPFHASRK